VAVIGTEVHLRKVDLPALLAYFLFFDQHQLKILASDLLRCLPANGSACKCAADQLGGRLVANIDLRN